jgi:GH25 family lysozyme M1 (1,4-beta-N-acetylmuramidase)
MHPKTALVAASLAAFMVLAGCGGGGGGARPGTAQAGASSGTTGGSSSGTTGGSSSGTTGGSSSGTTGGSSSGTTGGSSSSTTGGQIGNGLQPVPLPRGPVGGPRAEGADVSKYEGTVDWGRAKAAGLSFGIARVGDGLRFPDGYFAGNWSGMKAHGIIRGVYQFFRASQDPVQQADDLIAKVGPIGPGDLPPFMDMETLDGVSASTAVANMHAWFDRIQSRTGITPAIYTSRRVWNLLNNPTGFSMYDLWVANWGVSSPALPTQWKDWTFWQYTDAGTVDGINGSPGVDLDRFHGTVADLRVYAGLAAPAGHIRGLAVDSTGKGYWTCSLEGGVFAYGDATFRGTAGGTTHPEPILGIVRTPTGFGYWLFGADGAVYPFGDAVQAGGLAGRALAAPVVGMAATPSGAGYWLVLQDGTVSAFGDAQSAGQPSARQLTSGVVGIAATPSGRGYWLASADGNVYAFGDAPALGSAFGWALGAPIVGIAATPGGRGYWLAGADGIVQNFGDAALLYYRGSRPFNAPIVAITATLDGGGYWLVSGDATVFALGTAVDGGPRPR